MSVRENLAAAVLELERLGLRAEGYESGGDLGVVIGERTYASGAAKFRTRKGAIEWATMVATLAHGVEA